jgi:ubiquinone biosynthesis protein COQ4
MRHYGCSILLVPKDSRTFSVLNRPKPNYPGHIPLNGPEKVTGALIAAAVAYADPRRGGTCTLHLFFCSITKLNSADAVAFLGEVTAGPFIIRLRDAMLSDPTGRRILRDRPRINSKTMPTEYLRGFPENTFGRCLADYLDESGMSLDERDMVKHIDDEECAYVMQWYREGHDCWHALTGLPATFKEGEVALKAFEFWNTGLPMTFLSLFYLTKLKPEERSRFWKTYSPWAFKNGLNSKSIVTVYWKEELATDVKVLRARLGIEIPPDVRKLRKAGRGR